VAISLIECGFKIRSQIIWKKTVMAMSRGDYHWMHEPCWYAVKNTGRWEGDRKQTTIWEAASPIHIMGGSKEEKTPHPTQKPVELMRRSILNHTVKGDAVYDPFLGSGTTLIAAESTERICYGLEISPAYCDVIVSRWEKLTGKKATLESTGEVF
jgi:DNA modification methylase